MTNKQFSIFAFAFIILVGQNLSKVSAGDGVEERMDLRTVLTQTELEHSDDLDLETLMWLVETIKKVSRTLERREQEVRDLESLLRDSDLALRDTLEKKNRDIALLTRALKKKNGEVAILTQSLAAAQTEVKGLNKKVTKVPILTCFEKLRDPLQNIFAQIFPVQLPSYFHNGAKYFCSVSY